MFKQKCMLKKKQKKNFFFLQNIPKIKSKIKLPSTYFKNSASIKWPFEVDMP